MAEALRRLLWLLPIFAITSIALFAGLFFGLPAEADRPAFFNRSPTRASEHVRSVVARVAQGHAEARSELAALGGAALPVVLPELDRLPPTERGEVALALAPVARRMGMAIDPASLTDPERAVNFWVRFWQDRSLDFKPAVVSRLVRRLSERELALRSDDLIQLDTFALPELIRRVGVIREDADVERARRLLGVVSHVTERDFRIRRASTVEEAREQATRARRWWDENRVYYSELAGLPRLVATITETAYARWATRTLRELSGLDTSSLARRLKPALRHSGLLLSCVLWGGLFLGAPGAALGVASAPRGGSWVGWATATALGLGVPGLLFLSPSRSSTAAALACATLGGLLTLHLFRRELDERLDWRARFVLSNMTPLRRLRALSRWIATSIPTWAPLALAEATSIVFLCEILWNRPGLGEQTLLALRAGDLPWLMAVCMALGVSTSLLQIAADAFVGTPRWDRGEA